MASEATAVEAAEVAMTTDATTEDPDIAEAEAAQPLAEMRDVVMLAEAEAPVESEREPAR